MIQISKEHILIRSAVLADAPLLNAWWNDGAVMAHAGFPKGLGQSMEETRRQIAAHEGKLSQLCMILIDGKPVGEAKRATQSVRPGRAVYIWLSLQVTIGR